MDNSPAAPLQELAHLYGVETAYYDLTGQHQLASADALLAILRALGVPVTTAEDVPLALRERRQAMWRQTLEPVTVVWDGEALPIEVRLPSPAIDAPLAGHLSLESGEQLSWVWQGDPVVQGAEIEGTRYIIKRLSLPKGLPYGYHRLTLEVPGGTVESLIIAAPLKAYIPAGEPEGRRWGVFLPLYALNHEKTWGSGDFSDLEALITWTAATGGSVVATLPLLAAFLDEPFEPSPYSPASRLLWNEFYLDIAGVPELARCPSAQALLASSRFQEELDALRKLPFVDYRRQMALKRQVLEELSRCLAESPDRLESLRRFADANRLVEDYARFRAAGERQHRPWSEWPQPLRDGVLRDGDYDDDARRYHLYVQWLAQEQLQALSQKSQEMGVGLYLDLPLGVNPDGYDVWRERDLFALGASGGAPPDSFFVKGQNWGFPPLHPEKIRRQGYQYVIACLRQLLKYASVLRIDHVMQFHRLFWIPGEMEARQGVYVDYHPEEFYAILALESQRNKAVIVGEDLGTVPPEVRPAMSRHGLQRMYVLPFELTPDPERALPTVPADMVASLNTHDMPPFAAFWHRLGILDRQELGLLDEAGAQQEMERRQAVKNALVSFLQQAGWLKELSSEPQAVLSAALNFLSASQARIVLVNLEDLWLETQPQNTPGTWMERPNWCRKARYQFDVLRQLPRVMDVLREIDRIRRGGVARDDVRER